MNEEDKVLIDENAKPTDEILEAVLKQAFPAYRKLIDEVTSVKFNLDVSWNYYKDGKSWLCKITNRKRTVFWLSAWQEYFKVTFYFTDKFDEEIESSNISEELKKQYKENNAIGKLKPLTITVNHMDNIKDIFELIEIRK